MSLLSISLSPSAGGALALLASLVSATAFYAASPHCRWLRLRRAAWLGRMTGPAAAVAALWLWMSMLGAAAGLVVMLCSWMVAAMLVPALAAWHRPTVPAPRQPR